MRISQCGSPAAAAAFSNSSRYGCFSVSSVPGWERLAPLSRPDNSGYTPVQVPTWHELTHPDIDTPRIPYRSMRATTSPSYHVLRTMEGE
ncbi:uncharacterized protein ANIA_11342 [Aspergillus nidulans FGSC A4]|uniref:Uncharacterized protein n=1 Tax=Emericella nidulans (strain FGSC A4 / ATCC 38163 / CBS 112.46 / NRRL 194 / M139) TaxID=227321 RepID=C8VP86_EMENI|nr:hypothetical protein [Aspergillus nidulans FGSC A4]CBF86912.1 TPA: hypothetical protein ANIA_11342 [Aspergillus nidulans FGSC A4]